MVHVQNGVALLQGTRSIAGSTLTLDSALRRVVNAGVSIVDAVGALSTTPARVLGLSGRVGALIPGLAADLLVLDADLAVEGIMVDGDWERKPL
jgi:N-acetylglucosamine-6-phosphate deacetylase